jgi:hypothetical protein
LLHALLPMVPEGKRAVVVQFPTAVCEDGLIG